MNLVNRYIEEIERLITIVKSEEVEDIKAASQVCAHVISEGGFIYTFGTGHSHMLAEELFYRAGGLVRVYPILDPALMLHVSASRSSSVERLSGYAETLLNSIDDIRAGEVLFIFSNSGRNAVSVEMALRAKQMGLTVICLTSLKHSNSVASRHPSGKRLFEICDIVIDNHGSIGDAAIVAGDLMVSPTSTVIGAMIVQAIVAGTIECMRANGEVPEVFTSSNTDIGDSLNRDYLKQYRKRIKPL